ncbi:MBL fold metallo-hydrolase [Frigoriflavimonas asaccharolytica]|uniref:Glyoxylase-like metal-dependent hydrolase (Beta-lactamase superfamily II)/rhodanese-related sulfurtransferase n=1 Tax=Frigoriflavimonas asaccharolytica TaxID=2735899 RepID=A0A8J8G4K0_9FLAO|nr:MBL fold metallo-hydrolase [Frigoriflavimonas asaccharolytica]NRS91333.1 glyoxylase-like metal-dependent hydrolase (beta-lactamase superfamily II)/rhodanese-related sulfurtransferase [Frigoriflavimonas asaccharolytica]
MITKQFEYKPLSHYSYAIISEGKMAVIDAERDPQQYYDFAKENNAEIVAIFQTHPHADFVSSHLQIHQETGATIYNSEMLGADYPHKGFDEGDTFQLGNATLKAINTPGHSPDSITIVATEGDKTELFTGDTLFIGDVGRPDLREKAGNMKAKREELAEMMYETVQNKFTDLPNDAVVYPAHGAGSLCGKNLSDAASSTLGDERNHNWAFKKQSKEEFMETILDGQPIIPFYFGFNVGINKEGAKNLDASLANIPFRENATAEGLIVDARAEEKFKKGHLKGSINIQASTDTQKFETWLGAIIKPEEKFTLVVDSKEDKDQMLNRIAKIGYETMVKEVITLAKDHLETDDKLDLEDFKKHPENYTIVDIRNKTETDAGLFFNNAFTHPLSDLRDTASQIPTDKQIVVHCAGGYRSAAGSSIIESKLPNAKVYDLSDDVTQFQD